MENGIYKEIDGQLVKCEMSEIKKGDIWRLCDNSSLSLRYEALEYAKLVESRGFKGKFNWSVKPKILR